MDEFKKSRIDRVEEGLYSRTKGQEFSPRSGVSQEQIEVNERWKEENISDLLHKSDEQKALRNKKFLNKFLFASALFFILAIGITAFVFFGGRNFVSANNIDISVLGPTSVSGGAELSLDVTIKNGNKVDLEGAVLNITYPDGTRVSGNLDSELTRQREVVGKVPSHGEVTKTVKAVLFGEKETVKNIKMTLEYKVTGSSALFTKEKNYDISINSAPVIVTIDYPKEVNANQDFGFDVEIASNSGETLNNLLLTAEYPFGFTFTGSDPLPLNTNSTWKIGSLSSGSKKVIHIKGVLQAQNEEERTFRFTTGISSEGKSDVIGARFSELAESIKIKKPFIGLSVMYNDDGTTNLTTGLNQRIAAKVQWSNNVSGKLLNMVIEAKISGVSVDRSSVTASNGGFYRSVDNTVVWERSTKPEFSEVGPNEKGVVSFNFNTLPTVSKGAKNQNITISIKAVGNQLLAGVPQTVTSNTESEIKIGTTVGLSAKSVRSIGPFENMGPIPPRADKETTYTILWDLTNSLNDVKNVRVEGTLPTNVTWGNLTSPSNERISYDPVQRRVVWMPGDIPAGTGFTTKVREVAFQVTLLPSLSQVNSIPDLVTGISASGDDAFTGTTVEVTKQPLTTRTASDPAFQESDATVVK